MPYPEHDLLNMANVVSMPYQGKQAVTREAITIYDQIRTWHQFFSVFGKPTIPFKTNSFLLQVTTRLQVPSKIIVPKLKVLAYTFNLHEHES